MDELQKVEGQNPNYKFIATMTNMRQSPQSWQGETGHIGPEMLAKWIEDSRRAIYYTAGPPGMVAVMRQMLTTAGIGDDDIRTEEFTGY